MELWGYKTEAMFDVWSIEHFVTGMNMLFLSIGWHRLFRQPVRITPDHRIEPITLMSLIGWMIAVAYGWEAIEHYLETGLAGPHVAFWFQGVEHWSNRLIADPLLLLIGAAVAFKYRWLNIPAKIFSGSWLMLHVFVFPHSMYLQHYTPVVPL